MPIHSSFIPPITPLILVGLAATIEAAKRRKERKLRPLGQLIALRHDGRRVHVQYHAPDDLRNAPCVIMEAGANSWSPVWDDVAENVGNIARVFRYDRAGFGFSDACDARVTRNVFSIADDLRGALSTLGVAPPYILVAHSLGALYVNALVQCLHRKDVCGVVYVDAASPETVRMLEDVVPTDSPPVWVARLMGGLGVLRYIAPLVLRPYEEAFVGRMRREAMATWARGDWLVTYTREWKEAVKGSKLLEFPPGWLGSLPIAVVVPDVYERTEGKAYIGGLQRAVAEYSTDATVIAVEDCGHFVQIERPDVVAGAVETLIRRGAGMPTDSCT